jgi:hypothetical protein
LKLFSSNTSRALGLVGLLLCVCLAFCPRWLWWGEPYQGGRSLSAWLADLHDMRPERSGPARIAVCRIGTNAIPYLLRRLERQENRGDALLHKLDVVVNGSHNSPRRVEAQRDEAVSAFRLLGTNASTALPELSALLTNRSAMLNENVMTSVGYSLAAIDSGASRVLGSALDHGNRNVRLAAMAGLSAIGIHAKDQMRNIVGRLNDPDAEIRQRALSFVVRYENSLEEKRRLLNIALTDPDLDLQRLASRELKELENPAVDESWSNNVVPIGRSSKATTPLPK